MYDRPELQGAHTRLWDGVRAALAKAPVHLSEAPEDLINHWLRPDLVLSQTCGLPFRTALKGKVQLVGAPIYDLPCPSGMYFSVIITREASVPDSPRLAINGTDSQSGWAALEGYIDAQQIKPRDILVTGAHARSAQAVAEGQADMAAIDALTWRLMQRSGTAPLGLAVIAQTPPTPALPYICALGGDAPLVLSALSSAIAALSPEDRDLLGVSGVAPLTEAAYLAQQNPSDPASRGIPLLIARN